MGKSAKLYKKKPKSLSKSISSSHKRDNLLLDEDDNVAAQISFKKDLKAVKKEKEKELVKQTIAPQKSNKRLKSKIWNQLEEQRAKDGLPELATPKEAGIDYMSQWEKRSRR